MQVKASQASTMIAKFLRARLVPMVEGSPGIGKSSIAQQVAKEFNLKLIDIRLAQCDPTDLCGFPRIDGNKAGYVPMDTFPLDGDEIPKGYSGWLILFDEITSAPLSSNSCAVSVWHWSAALCNAESPFYSHTLVRYSRCHRIL